MKSLSQYDFINRCLVFIFGIMGLIATLTFTDVMPAAQAQVDPSPQLWEVVGVWTGEEVPPLASIRVMADTEQEAAEVGMKQLIGQSYGAKVPDYILVRPDSMGWVGYVLEKRVVQKR